MISTNRLERLIRVGAAVVPLFIASCGDTPSSARASARGAESSSYPGSESAVNVKTIKRQNYTIRRLGPNHIELELETGTTADVKALRIEAMAEISSRCRLLAPPTNLLAYGSLIEYAVEDANCIDTISQ